MGAIIILGTMSLSAFVAFVLCARLMTRGRSGAVMTLLALIGAALSLLVYATNNTFGLDPVQAWSWALLAALPALLGAGAGTLLGWLIRKRADRQVPR